MGRAAGLSRRAPRLLAVARAAPLLAAFALSGCAPVGPNFERPAAIVSPQFKEIKGWKIATPRANEPKGEWWSVFHDPELDQLDAGRRRCPTRRSRRTRPIIAQALALINEARAGLFPTVNGDRLGDARLARRHESDRGSFRDRGRSTSGVRSGARSRRSRRARRQAPPILANASLAAQSALALAYVTLRQADLLEDLLARTVDEYQAFGDDHAEPV